MNIEYIILLAPFISFLDALITILYHVYNQTHNDEVYRYVAFTNSDREL